MPSIVNGLFAGRSGINSHGAAIAVVGDNIANASTVGFKSARTEFEDLVAGGQAAGRVVGSGSQVAAINPVFEQGTLEFTSRPLDLAIDGNGFFVVAQGEERYYTRAGNFKVDESGYIVNQDGLAVLGFPSNGTGSLQPVNINTVSQDSVATTSVTISGNVDASDDILPGGVNDIPTTNLADGNGGNDTTTYAELNDAASFSTVVDVFDSLGQQHTITYFFFHTGVNQYTARGYVTSDDVDGNLVAGTEGRPRLLTDGTTGNMPLQFNGSGSRTNAPTGGAADLTATVQWANSADPTPLSMSFDPFTQFSAPGNILSITQDGQGIGTVGSVSIDKDGSIFAVLSNGQTATIGNIGLVNFSNPEGLRRIGNNLLQQAPDSGEPVIGRPQSGTFGAVQSGSLELSTVDIAAEFVKLITLQRGFQANSRIITTINQLLNEIIQLA